MFSRVTALALCFAVVACGGSARESTPNAATTQATATDTATPNAEAALKTAVAAYSKAYLTGDGASGYALLSKKCQRAMPLSQFAALTEDARSLYGNVKISTLDVKINGEHAEATYTYPVKAINQIDEPWVNEAGWKNNDC